MRKSRSNIDIHSTPDSEDRYLQLFIDDRKPAYIHPMVFRTGHRGHASALLLGSKKINCCFIWSPGLACDTGHTGIERHLPLQPRRYATESCIVRCFADGTYHYCAFGFHQAVDEAEWAMSRYSHWLNVLVDQDGIAIRIGDHKTGRTRGGVIGFG